MNRFVPLLVAVMCVTMACADVTTLWPQPLHVNSSVGMVSVDTEAFKIVATCETSSILSAAVKRSMFNLFPFGAGSGVGADAGAKVSTVKVCVQSSDTSLSLETDESYELSVSADGLVSVSASTVYGAMYGLQTLSQLIEWNPSNETYTIASTPISIADAPHFKWRGLLMDTARHYYEVDALLHLIEAMSFNKLNVLHWHIVDAESFPFAACSAFPKLSGDGAWAPEAVYTAEDVETVVAYAQSFGIRVVPEFDGPGHMHSWAQGYPDLGTTCAAPLQANINNMPFSPASESTLPTIQAVYDAAAELFPDAYFHTGGDEVVQECWSQDPAVAAWMQDRGYNDLDVYQYFEDNFHAFAKANNRSVIVWEDVFDNGLKIPADTVVEVWRDIATLNSVVAAGYKSILAAGYYLDKQVPGNATDLYYEWTSTYLTFLNNYPGNNDLILGGELAMWSECVSGPNFDSRIWSRAPGGAWTFWSNPDDRASAATPDALNAHLCRMQQRGIRCGPIAPSYCPLPDAVQPFKRRLGQ